MKKVAVVGIVGLPACYGGFETLVENLTGNVSDDITYSVFCSSKSYDIRKAEHNGAKLDYLPLSANGIQSIPYDIFSLIKCWGLKPDVTLILGVSGCIFLPVFRLFSKSKIITNIDGLEWKREKWHPLAKKFLKLSEKIAVKYSNVIICDNQAIGDYVTSEYDTINTIIAYGGDHVIPKSNVFVDREDFYFSVCRIEPENNVEMILKAFSKTDKNLKFVGNWDASDFGAKLKLKYSNYSNIDIIDPIYDLEELYKLRKACKGYLHGHSAGGTNPSLVEAMHFGMPILAFNCSFNRYSTEDKAMYFSSADSLVSLLDKDHSSAFIVNAANMLEVAQRKYTWQRITNAYELTY
ncbi:DUF1972 domain-containing protein [Photobacterium chitinilyticum]|uniref:Glycosyltransferase family 1 protein n=1 Tax=Photobacterium chitinilyticum TaxID=2485123 RepID=A0A3S3UNH7_9GAMM|nr:DUF1972 domain-containing protein [Photobacterium chitinilyticum]RWX56615.1 glycosyltransferase family 1 protein [Photobacterium chitinilyticum]